jgi:signal transduction histidine kinase
LNLFDRRTQQFTEIKTAAGVAFAEARYLHEDRFGRMWYAGGNGLWRFDYKTKHAAHFEVVPEALPNSLYNYFKCLCEDQSGMLWCGGMHGLHKFDPHAAKFIAYYYEQDGLPSNRIDKIVEDDAGGLWLLTGRGLSVFNERAAPGRQFRNFDLSDGVDNSSISAGMLTPLLKSKSGDMYWGGANGLYRFYPKHLTNNPLPPPVVLTEFKLFNEATKLDTAVSALGQIRLSYRENFFSFAFAALDYTNVQKNRFAYKLEGFDENWIDSSNKREANYTNVPPGEYVFRVKGANSDGVWNEEGAAVRIIISPPYWQTWWFRALALAVIVGILEALHRYRVVKKLEIERTRNRIARDLHDEIGSNLSSIALMSELIQEEPGLAEKIKSELKRIGATAQNVIDAMADLVWTVNPHYDKLENLLLRMKEIAVELLDQKQICYSFHFPEDDAFQPLKMDFRHNLLLIYKEILHNIVKHAGATHVDISITKTDGCLTMKLADDGIGFDPGAVRCGNGLKNVQARAAELHGRIEIESQNGHGTVATLVVKIP